MKAVLHFVAIQLGHLTQKAAVKLSNINNLRFTPGGRLTALGYDGRVYILSDSDGDGLEDEDRSVRQP
jgi:hypothetical protein